MTPSAGAGEAAGTAHGIAGLETGLWGCWGSQPSVPALWCVSLGWMGMWNSRSGGPAWLPWWLSISSKLTSNYMVNGITVKSSSLSSPGLNAPLGQRHLMALQAGSGLWKSAFGSHWPEVIFALPVLQPTFESFQNGIGQENAPVCSALLGLVGLSLAGVAWVGDSVVSDLPFPIPWVFPASCLASFIVSQLCLLLLPCSCLTTARGSPSSPAATTVVMDLTFSSVGC